MSKDCGKFRRGQVWMYVDRDSLYNGTPAPGPMVGSRPVVIISEDDYNDSESWSVVCLKMTSNPDTADFDYCVSFSQEGVYNKYPISIVKCDQIETISKTKLPHYLFTLNDDVMEKIEEKCSKFLNLSEENLGVSLHRVQESINRTFREKEKQIRKASMLEIKAILENMQNQLMDTINKMSVTSTHKKKSEDVVDSCKQHVENIEQTPTKEEDEYAPIEGILPSGRKPKGFWTNERMSQFMVEAAKMTPEQIERRWKIPQKRIYNTVADFRYRIKLYNKTHQQGE